MHLSIYMKKRVLAVHDAKACCTYMHHVTRIISRLQLSQHSKLKFPGYGILGQRQ